MRGLYEHAAPATLGPQIIQNGVPPCSETNKLVPIWDVK